MKLCPLAFDKETWLIRPSRLAPEPVCTTWAIGQQTGILHNTEVEPWLKAHLQNPEILFVGANIAFDWGVAGAAWPSLIPLIFKAYESDRVTDVQLRAKLIDIAHGCFRGRFADDGKVWLKNGYSLAELTRRHTGVNLKKDGWRLRYQEFTDTPISGWVNKAKELQEKAYVFLTGALPAEKDMSKDFKAYVKDMRAILEDSPQQVIDYAVDDAKYTLAVYEAQEYGNALLLKDQFRQARAAWALHLSSAWGLRTNKAGVDALRVQTEAALVDVQARLIAAGLVRADGSRDTKKAAAHMEWVCTALSVPLRKTPADGVCLDADACEATENPLLVDYAEFSTLGKTLNADIPMLEKGTVFPIHPRYDIAESGRTTCSGPNIQNLRRLPGIREAFTARDGHVLVSCDFPSLELFSLAECCVQITGRSSLADALNKGIDPHTALAAEILGITYEAAVTRRKAGDKEVDNARQTSKVANFGLPGGLGAKRLVHFAHSSYDVTLTEERAKELKSQWFARWPEMKGYFAHINGLCSGGDKTGIVVSPFTERVRGGCNYTAACNSFFQGLGADCAKRAMWLVAKAQYTQPKSPLWGTRTIAMVHDELILEVPENEKLHAAAYELARLMSEGACEYLPHVPIPAARIEPAAMRVWSKDAKQVFDSNGRLVPWESK